METWKRAIAFTALLGATALGVAFLLQPGRALRSTVSVSGAAPALGYGVRHSPIRKVQSRSPAALSGELMGMCLTPYR